MAESTITVTIPADIVSKTGPRIIGYLLHWGLFGVLCMQVYLYYIGFPRDPRRNKIFVFSVFVLEVVQTAIITQSAFTVFGSGYGQFSEYNHIRLAWFSVPVISGLVAFIAEIFYAFRIRILSESNTAAGIIAALAFVQLIGAIATAVVLKQAVLFSRLLNPHFFITAAIWNGGSALCDVIIAGYMTYYLSRHSDSSGIRSTQVLLQRIIRLVIETGSITAAIAILNLILALLPSHPSYFEVPSEVLAKVYSNSMMVVLNSRLKITTEGPALNNFSITAGTMCIRGLAADNASQSDTETFEMHQSGIMITREQLVLPETDPKDRESGSQKYPGTI